MAMIRLVACDIDGTLLNSQHQIAPEDRAALLALAARGIPVVLASGRARVRKTLDVIEELGLKTPGIFLQGALVYDALGRVQHQHTLSPVVVADVVVRAAKQGCTPLLYSGEVVYAAREDTYTTHIYGLGEAQTTILPDFERAALSHPINKLVIWGTADDMLPLRADIARRWGDAVRLVQALPKSLSGMDAPNSLEVLPPGVNKGAALQEILLDFRLVPEQALALGDGENDIELLQVAGVGVAMGNAPPEVQAVADWVAPDHDHAGVAAALTRYVLGE